MQILKTIAEAKEVAILHKKAGKTIGLVPTMGYLHAGHLSLIEEARAKNDIVFVSIFVNPIQFGPNEDYDSYPRDLVEDAKLCEAAGVDYIFAPMPSDMYPKTFSSQVKVDKLGDNLCGVSRPGHFDGVTTVVSKLFNITRADNAYFGQKDGQQLAIIMRMVEDLNMNIAICPMPIVREVDGLALSSRNVYLTSEERKEALVLNRSLGTAKLAFQNGIISAEQLVRAITMQIKTDSSGDIDYVKVVDYVTMGDINGEITSKAMIALAVRFGKTRLIDNIILEK